MSQNESLAIARANAVRCDPGFPCICERSGPGDAARGRGCEGIGAFGAREAAPGPSQGCRTLFSPPVRLSSTPPAPPPAVPAAAPPEPSQGRRTLFSPPVRPSNSPADPAPSRAVPAAAPPGPRLRSPREDGPRLRCRRSRAGQGPCSAGPPPASAMSGGPHRPGAAEPGGLRRWERPRGDGERGGQRSAGRAGVRRCLSWGGSGGGCRLCSPCSSGEQLLLLRPRPPAGASSASSVGGE